MGQDLINAGVDLVWPKPPPGPAVMKAKIEELLISRVHTMRDEKPL